MDNKNLIIGVGVLVVLTVIGATYTDNSTSIPAEGPEEPQSKSLLIFNTLKEKGIAVENAYTTNGTEIKKAFGLEDSDISPNTTVAFVIFTYSSKDGVEKKVDLTLDVIYTALQVEPSIDGILVMPYDPDELTLGAGPNMIYANRSYAQELALQGVPAIARYNNFDMYTIISEVYEG
jgi:hypothetical protein